MQSCEFALSVSTLACCIAEGKSPEEIALISSIFMQLGDTLATIAAHQALCCPPKDTNKQAASTDANSPKKDG